ncbi:MULTISPECIES: ABC transporter substrate-binding protein [Rhodopseudomonas]|uniref:ABC transporter substrate-binding protein n=1 Tax=Rhodopseudomonas palustris TaxID=1076 RepID=A0A0D7EKC4_RHOPL|nr:MULTISPECIES: ABC transporter substrate-binding protein [Rhodopseudomonas]KIZ40990.1 ABC transporter substrate-binding protein [Rhodopseudomonas palustris]MDF3813473.1 ABC transporter substrate-binding protein [Rhodopseudomonas sp. BAL398]WOK18699.1 ABC transporter substrate-binding protein [Rhodopseudomonas sp. BAL398]
MRSIQKFVGAVTVVASLAIAGTAPTAAMAKQVTISQAFQSMLYLPFYVAIDKGFFKEQGVDVDKQTAGSPTTALSSVLSGSAQFSIHGPEWTAIANSKGADVDIICNVVNGAAVWVAATPNFKFDSIKDVKGQKVVSGLMPTTSTSLFMKLLKDNGMNPDADVDLLQVQIGAEPGPFLGGQAKLAVFYEPGLDQVVAKGMKVVVSFPKSYGPYAFSSITAKKDVDPKDAQAVVNAMELALRFMQANPDETVAIAKKEFPTLDGAIVEAAVRRMMKEEVYPSSVQTSPQAYKTAMQTQIALGNLKEAPTYETFVVQDYVKNALALPK